MNQITVIDETTGTALLFEGGTQEEAVARMNAWADHGEPTRTRRATVSTSGAAGFSFDVDEEVFGSRS